MSTAARQEFENKYSAEHNYARLMSIYSFAQSTFPKSSEGGTALLPSLTRS
jgi:hypothetical protein